MWSPGWPGPCRIPTLSSHLAPTYPGPSKPLPLTFPSELQPSEASPPGTLPGGAGAEVVLALPDGLPASHTLKRHTLRVCLSACRCVPWKKELQEGAGECLGPSLTPGTGLSWKGATTCQTHGYSSTPLPSKPAAHWDHGGSKTSVPSRVPPPEILTQWPGYGFALPDFYEAPSVTLVIS